MPKGITEKSRKQIGQLVSAEREEVVTFGKIISSRGNTVPPLLVFPRGHFKKDFESGYSEGSSTTKSV